MTTHSSILPRKSHGDRSLPSNSPWVHKELDTTEHHHHQHMDSVTESIPNPLSFHYINSSWLWMVHLYLSKYYFALQIQQTFLKFVLKLKISFKYLRLKNNFTYCFWDQHCLTCTYKGITGTEKLQILLIY